MFRQGYQLDLDEWTQEETIATHTKVLEQDEGRRRLETNGYQSQIYLNSNGPLAQ